METDTSRMVNLNGSNYHLWKTRMEDLLYIKGFHQPITCSKKPDDKTDEEWSVLNRRVCGYIRQWVDDIVLSHVSRDINAHTLWSKLEKMYAPKTCNSRLRYMKELMNLRYHDGTEMSGHLDTFQGLMNRLSEMGVKIDDEVQGLWLLGTLPDSWETLRTSLLNVTPGGVISVELAKHSILNEDMRRSLELALYDVAPHLYTTIKVACDEDLRQQIGKDIFFDLVDHDKVFSIRIHKQTPFARVKEEVARKFGVTAHCQRFWFWTYRQNRTYRPTYPLTPQEEAQPVGQLLEILNKTKKTKSSELKLFLEDSWPIPPPVKTQNTILLFFKLYDPFEEELRYVGRLWVKPTGKPKEILTKLNELVGFAPGQEIELFEEIRFAPKVMCLRVDKEQEFRASEIEDGDIICFQKLVQVGSTNYRYPDVPSFLEHIRKLQK